jgi:hypothetical protein
MSLGLVYLTWTILAQRAGRAAAATAGPAGPLGGTAGAGGSLAKRGGSSVSASQIAVPGAFAGPAIFAGAGRMGLAPGCVTGAAASAAGAGNLR